MSTDTNKRLVLRFMNEFLVNHNRDVLDEVLGPDYTQHNPAIEDGKAGLIKFFEAFWQKYPRTEYRIKRILAENDLVAIHYHWVVQPGVFERAIVDIFRIEDDRLVEHWDVVQPIPQTSVNPHPLF